MRLTSFNRYIGIDYSGAKTPNCSLKGLRVYQATPKELPEEVPPPPGKRKYWTRRGLAEWLAERLSEEESTLVGIDHSFSFPLRYFEVHRLEPENPDPAVPAGGVSPRCGPGPSRCFISMCRGRWPSRPMPEFPGYAICACG
ncbi:hypothetical protein [Candidatus Thiodiazotropha sp. CDECU1]|uniref:hypothetical protein n=1 Tax=Candidatus Thiodiazotropha sp. CDECU1 TaxID=3065865 RepID=UPI00292D701E|nr:hypothetical protein [Candidatus Thiodiazotropha sp. CDECU1]